MNYMMFKDGSKIVIENGSSLGHIVHIARNEASALFVCEKCTPENVSDLVFLQADEDTETIIGEFSGLALNEAPTRQTNEDGLSVTVVISVHETDHTD